MIAMTVDSAKSIGVAVVVALIAILLAMIMLIKKATGKLIAIVIVGGLAIGVWSQRSSLQDCADNVKARGALGATSDVSCKFMGTDVKVSAP